ncbi:hypothetical protein ALC62_06580 [Cyphomyrmex costatus]|uniref:Uncharacterized protein n=1 Tax=Cyphomyrmex costatus TaxID=456900 RepID=A0A151IIV9_9HYME|nr:hypothetical protein ALC62_06580 [Cyphomyrmex costatus]
MFSFYSAKESSALCEPKKESDAMKRRAVRILSRRYDLTATGYKFLEIEINVDPPSYVEIVLGDHHGRELSLSLETWKGLYEQRWNIYKLLRNEYKSNFITIGPMTIRICTHNDVTLVRLESSTVHMTMIESTLRRMFNLDGCVDVTFERLSRLIDTVDALLQRRERYTHVFDKRQLVDCELLALVFNM